MLFRILGPLEVRTHKGWRGIAALKQRTLLAALLLRPGQVVSVDCLADALWGEDPPRGARKQVSGYILRLRRMIDDPDGGRLVTRSPGYQLLAGRADLDTGVFEALLAAGRAALERQAGKEAATLLSDALSLWRGTLLADVRPGPLVTDEVSRLTELWLNAVELRIEADLLRGRPAQVVPELRRLSAEHPLHERVWNLLMRALHDCGRPAEALKAYARAKDVLAAELGTHPGPELRQLHQQILAGSPASPRLPLPAEKCLGVAGQVPTTAAAAPRQLPVAVRHFRGRSDELLALDRLLDQAARKAETAAISAISGTAGVGKTALVVHWAHRVAQHFPDGQLYIDLLGFAPGGTPVSAATALRDFLDALNVPAERLPATTTAQAALFRTLVAGKRMLIILDNARDADHVRPLLPGTPTCMVIVTSRTRLTSLAAIEGAELLTLDVLTLPESRELLAHRLGRDRTAAEPEAVDELIESCARLPLALSITAALAADRTRLSLGALTKDLRDGRSLDVLDAGGAASSVRAAFSWSCQQLTDPATRMFQLLGIHPGPDITGPAAASLAGMPPGQARQALHELTMAHLTTERGPGRYALNGLLRAYAADQAASSGDQTIGHTAFHRVLDHYLHTAHTAAMLLYPRRDPLALDQPWPGTRPEELADHQHAMAWFDDENPVLFAIILKAAASGFDTHVVQLAWTLDRYFEQRGRWHDYATIQQTAAAAAQHLGDQPDRSERW